MTLAVAALGLLWPVGSSSASAHELGDDGAVYPSAFHNHIVQTFDAAVEVPPRATTQTGTLSVIWGDGQADSGRAHRQDLVLATDAGERLLIDPDQANLPPGGLLSLDRQRVSVSGDLQVSRAGSAAPQAASGVIKNASVQGADGRSTSANPAVSGAQRWATILCRFADTPSVTPRANSYFENLLAGTSPGLDHYWRELSYNNANISGSIVVGWYNLPRARSAYVTRNSQNVEVADLGALATDCTAAADANVYFPDFVGVNLMFNGELDGYAWGGSNYLSRDGQSRVYRTTWMPTWGYGNQDILAHEMGHGFGLPHSSGPYSTPYDSMWDPMSAGGTCAPADPTYGCIAVHTIAFHKDRLGWIPADRKYTAAAVSNQTITIDRIDTLPTASGTYLMAQIPFGNTGTTFYTVETRRFDGYDGGSGYRSRVPGEAVLIHKVNTTLGDRLAQVVDPDDNGNPNDLSAIWSVGETFRDSANQISVSVLSATSTGYVVQIQKGSAPSTASLTVTPAGSGSGSVSSSPSGIICGVDCTESFAANTVVTLTATPDSSSIFSGWSGACSGTSSCVLTMSANRSVTATFAPNAAPTLNLANGTVSVQTGGPVGVKYTNPAPTGNDKVSLHTTGANDSVAVSTQSANKTSATLSFSAPSTKGNYEFRFFRDGVKVATSASFNVTGPPTADLSLTVIESADPVKKNTNLTYTMTITNNGPDAATNVTLSDTLPSRTTYVSSATTQGKCAHSSSTKFTCSVGTIASGASVKITLVVRPSRVGSITNSVSVSSSQSDPVTNNNRVSIQTIVN